MSVPQRTGRSGSCERLRLWLHVAFTALAVALMIAALVGKNWGEFGITAAMVVLGALQIFRSLRDISRSTAA